MSESLPPPRPTHATSPLTRCLGGSRSATSRNSATSVALIGSANAALLTARQRSQDGPSKYGPNNSALLMASVSVIFEGAFMRHLSLVRRTQVQPLQQLRAQQH